MSESTSISERPRIEIFYFDGCPNHDAFLPHLRDLLARPELVADVVTTRVGSDQDAQRLAFLGSPTVRINGCDVDPGAEFRTGYGMQCRLYHTPDGLTGTPPDAWILAALDPTMRPEGARPSTVQERQGRPTALWLPQTEPLQARPVQAVEEFGEGDAEGGAQGQKPVDADLAGAGLPAAP